MKIKSTASVSILGLRSGDKKIYKKGENSPKKVGDNYVVVINQKENYEKDGQKVEKNNFVDALIHKDIVKKLSEINNGTLYGFGQVALTIYSKYTEENGNKVNFVVEDICYWDQEAKAFKKGIYRNPLVSAATVNKNDSDKKVVVEDAESTIEKVDIEVEDDDLPF